MTALPLSADAARVSRFLADHPQWSACWESNDDGGTARGWGAAAGSGDAAAGPPALIRVRVGKPRTVRPKSHEPNGPWRYGAGPGRRWPWVSSQGRCRWAR
jgi:hypothetical protein